MEEIILYLASDYWDACINSAYILYSVFWCGRLITIKEDEHPDRWELLSYNLGNKGILL